LYRKRKKDTVTVILFLFFATLYGFNASISFNTLGEQEIIETHQAIIQNKRVSRGRSTNYYLYLSEWGEQREGKSVSISRRTFNSAEINDPVTIRVFSDLLGIRYFRVRVNED